MPRPAQPVAQPRPAFSSSFAPPTAPTIPLTATKGVFTFGSTARFDLATQGPANLRVAPRAPGKDTVAKPALTAPLNGPKPHPARCKQNGVTPSLGSLQSDKSSGPPCQVEEFVRRFGTGIRCLHSSASCRPSLSYSGLTTRFTTSQEEGPGMQE